MLQSPAPWKYCRLTGSKTPGCRCESHTLSLYKYLKILPNLWIAEKCSQLWDEGQQIGNCSITDKWQEGRKDLAGPHSHQKASMVFDVYAKISPPSQQHQRTAKPSHLHAHPRQFQPQISAPVPGSRKAHLHSCQPWGFAGSHLSTTASLEICREESAVPRVLLMLQAGSYTCHSGAQSYCPWKVCRGDLSRVLRVHGAKHPTVLMHTKIWGEGETEWWLQLCE